MNILILEFQLNTTNTIILVQLCVLLRSNILPLMAIRICLLVGVKRMMILEKGEWIILLRTNKACIFLIHYENLLNIYNYKWYFIKILRYFDTFQDQTFGDIKFFINFLVLFDFGIIRLSTVEFYLTSTFDFVRLSFDFSYIKIFY